MGRKKQPIALLKAKGNKHLTKKEIEDREKSEVKTFDDNLQPPIFLQKSLHDEFNFYATELQRIGVICNLDVDILAEYVRVKFMYNEVTKRVLGALYDDVSELKDIVNIQDKLFKQLIRLSSELGLTITSRGKLIMPENKDEEIKDDVSLMFGGIV